MTVFFDGAGFQAEQLCAKQFRGCTTSNKEHQYKDIDCFVSPKDSKKVYSASVKDQRTSTKLGYDTIQLELELVNTDTNKTIEGCFYKNESDFYFWLIHKDGEDWWCIVKSSTLKKYVKENKPKLKTWQTKQATEDKNRSYGRFYNRSKGVLVSFSVLQELGQLVKLKVNS